MQGRERVSVCARGGQADRRAVISWSSGADRLSDGYVASSLSSAREILADRPDAAVMVRVDSPLGRDLQDAGLLLDLLQSSPSQGARLLAQRKEEARQAISEALDSGADGIAYILSGAVPGSTTPMQYGGHFLEVDRELLEEVQEARFNLLWVAGTDEPYLDFVADLPAHAMGWDIPGSGIQPSSLRGMREGALAGAHPDCDIYLVEKFDQAAEWLDTEALN